MNIVLAALLAFSFGMLLVVVILEFISLAAIHSPLFNLLSQTPNLNGDSHQWLWLIPHDGLFIAAASSLVLVSFQKLAPKYKRSWTHIILIQLPIAVYTLVNPYLSSINRPVLSFSNYYEMSQSIVLLLASSAVIIIYLLTAQQVALRKHRSHYG